MEYMVGLVLEEVDDPDGLARWCNDNEAVAVERDGMWEIVSAPTIYGTLPEDPAPTREELASGMAELADMMAAQSATNDEVMAALAEIGDAVAALAGEE